MIVSVEIDTDQFIADADINDEIDQCIKVLNAARPAVKYNVSDAVVTYKGVHLKPYTVPNPWFGPLT